MSTNPFETKVGKWLKELPWCFSYHPPDLPRAKSWAPADFFFGLPGPGGWGWIECKQVHGMTFPLSGWTPQQRQFCSRIRACGGRYLLFVDFAGNPTQIMRAYSPDPAVSRGSLAPAAGHLLGSAELAGVLLSREIGGHWKPPVPGDSATLPGMRP